jgi:hypothetical protein
MATVTGIATVTGTVLVIGTVMGMVMGMDTAAAGKRACHSKMNPGSIEPGFIFY